MRLKKDMKIKKIDSSSVFGDTGNEYLKTKIKSYNNKIITNFHGKLPKEGVECVCLSAVVVSLFSSRVKIIILRYF